MAVYELGGRRIALPEGGAVFIAPSASVMGHVVLGPDASIWFGAVLRGDNEPITIGARSNVQDNAVLHTDLGAPLTLGCDVTVGHGCVLHGCAIGDRSLVGIGSIVLNRAVIGPETLIGANTLVPEGKSFPEGVLLLGSPARVVRALSAEERALLKASADIYVANGRRFAEGLRPDPRWR